MSKSTSSSAPADILGTPQQFTLPRDDDLDLSFSGWLLECTEDEKRKEKGDGLRVCIYFTEGRSVVTQVVRWYTIQGDRTEHNYVGVFDSFNWDGAVEWLKDDNSGRLGGISKQAWIEACQKLPELKSHSTERVS